MYELVEHGEESTSTQNDVCRALEGRDLPDHAGGKTEAAERMMDQVTPRRFSTADFRATARRAGASLRMTMATIASTPASR